MAYIPALKGYINDVPEIWLKRNDGRVFHFDQLSSSNVTPENNFTEITGGWGLYPVAYLPGQSTMEMTFESAQFDAELFALANNETFEEGDMTTYETQTIELVAGEGSKTAKITTAYSLSAEGVVVSINGMQKADTAAEGKFTVGQSQASTDGQSFDTVITFASTETAAEVEVHIERVVKTSRILVDNQSTFVGSCVLRWPVYASGEETNAAGVKGYAVMNIFKCRCTAMPGFDASYKSAQTPGITVAVMDPHRADGNIYAVGFIEK